MGKNDSFESKLYELQLKKDFHDRVSESGMLPYSDLTSKYKIQEYAMLKYKMEPKNTRDTRKDILVQDVEPSPVLHSHNTSALM